MTQMQNSKEKSKLEIWKGLVSKEFKTVTVLLE